MAAAGVRGFRSPGPDPQRQVGSGGTQAPQPSPSRLAGNCVPPREGGGKRGRRNHGVVWVRRPWPSCSLHPVGTARCGTATPPCARLGGGSRRWAPHAPLLPHRNRCALGGANSCRSRDMLPLTPDAGLSAFLPVSESAESAAQRCQGRSVGARPSPSPEVGPAARNARGGWAFSPRRWLASSPPTYPTHLPRPSPADAGSDPRGGTVPPWRSLRGDQRSPMPPPAWVLAKAWLLLPSVGSRSFLPWVCASPFFDPTCPGRCPAVP